MGRNGLHTAARILVEIVDSEVFYISHLYRSRFPDERPVVSHIISVVKKILRGCE